MTNTHRPSSRRRATGAAAACAAALLVTVLHPVPAAAAGDQLVANSSFETFDVSGPSDWGTWTPAGSATYTQVTSHDGSDAAQIETATTGSRGFLVQDVAVPSGAETLDMSFWQEKSALSGSGKAAIRVTFNGAPAQFLGVDGASTWRKVESTLTVPAGSTSVRIEPMVDYLQGQMRVDDVELRFGSSKANLGVNTDFEAFSASSPDNWNHWLAAGSGTVSKVAGVEGDNALGVTTDSTSSRLALTQDVTLPAGGAYVVDFSAKIDSITGNGQAGIRVDVLDGSRGSAFIGRTTTTSGWERMSGAIVVPSDATKIRLHVFNDGVKAVAAYDDIHVGASTAEMNLSTGTTKSGDISLSWTKPSDAPSAKTYDIHRATSGDATESSPLLRTVPASLLKATDQEWLAGKTYSYLVIARDAAGAEVARSTGATTSSPSSDATTTSVVSIAQAGSGDHIGWRCDANAALPLTVVGSSSPVTSSNVSSASTLASGLDRLGGIDIAGAAYVGLVDANGTLIATASREDLGHPRIGLDAATLTKINNQISQPGTPQDAWNTVKARVDDGVATFGYSEDRYAREAAFVYQVTQDASYAALAYDAFVTAAEKTPFEAEQELNTANPVSSLAVAYDWASPAWSDAQKAYAHDYFQRTAVFFEHVQHPNLTLADKASNWVAVVRGAELAQHVALRGEGDYGYRDARIGRLADQLNKHLLAANSEHGWFQEGLDYLDYTNMIAVPGVLGSFDAGIDALRDAWHRPDTADLLLHTVSLREPGHKLQWGVGNGPGGANFPLYLQRAKAGELAPMIDIFERTQGHRATEKWYSPGFITQAFIDWPESIPAAEAYDPATVYPALLDDEAGAASFRNRIVDADDVLLQLNNRNHKHLGWSGHDTFGLSLMSHDTTWAGQPGKDQSNAAKYSRVLIDGKTAQTAGGGQTLGSAAYAGQGGGYVKFDGAGNVGVDVATREAVVDMTDRGDVDTIVALRDTFSDAASHDWTWQLAPEAGVTLQTEMIGTTLQFTVQNGDAWMRGWVLNAEDVTANTANGVLSLTRTGSASTFDVALAVGRSATVPSSSTTGAQVTIADTTIDLADLGGYHP